MTPFAMVGLVWLVPAAVILVVLGRARRRRLGPHRRIWFGVTAASLSFLLAVGAVVAGWALSDAADELEPRQHAAVRPALAASYQCGLVPFARVLDVEVDPDTMDLHFTCGWTHLGLFARSGKGRCGDGTWMVPNVMDMRWGGDCSDPQLFGDVSR